MPSLMLYFCMSYVADNLVAAGLDMQLQALQERLTELQNERKEKPKPDEDLEVAPTKGAII